MKFQLLLLFCTFLFVSCQAEEQVAQIVPPTTTTAAQPTDTPAPTAVPTSTPIATPNPIPVSADEGWELVWSDEFDGDEINRSNWTFDIGGWGWGNGEAQYYTDRPENARVENGLLVIEARQEKFEDSYYTSARLLTQGLHAFQYGRIEARIKVPGGIGTWPAFWMLGDNFGRDTEDPTQSNWPNVGEIDIMEYVG
ncbi:MAG: glycoside hydrolase family 16 protein, partial [Anaerolineales bacterium]|nr:glycoside hydrolase family 16 protein [Anaerolineales bacterium]